ncbi:MAG TPA: hypothetical protein DCZ95_14465 [Verrucomicrobia bacterium]|nr:MAG: hypothetical protein A2X46_07115 [Lentisphaerae bacterium GWF2_57_35]HBA85287.1 hypothetical protein [Verrucomicrobiota bacterium]
MKIYGLLVVIVGMIGMQTVMAELPNTVMYQGRLVENNGPVNGARSVRFDIYNDPTAGQLLYTETDSVTCNDGLFSTTMGDADPTAFARSLGSNGVAWLQVRVNLNPMGGRQRLLAVPFAVHAGQARELSNQGMIGARIEAMTSSGQPRPAVMLGATNNTIGEGSSGASIGGGANNVIGTNASYSRVAGGANNNIGHNSAFSSVGGGYDNDIDAEADYSFVGGGNYNDIGDQSSYSVVSGGALNDIGTNANYSVILGGNICAVADNAAYALAAGRRAKANHPGAFVLADAQNADFASGTSNSFNARFLGGYHLSGGAIKGDGSALSNLAAATLSEQGIVGARILPLSFLGEPLPVLVLGSSNNQVGAWSYGSVIGGGAYNSIGADVLYGTVAGGMNGDIGANSSYATIAGGSGNSIGTNAIGSTVAGGYNCDISDNAQYAYVAGRRAKAHHTGAWVLSDSQNADFASVTTNSFNARFSGGYYLRGGVVYANGSGVSNVIAAGVSDQGMLGVRVQAMTLGIIPKPSILLGATNNSIGAGSYGSAIGGGSFNEIGTNSFYSTVPGGQYCEVGHNARYAFAAGRSAKALHSGSFVLSDSQNTDYSSAASNSFNARFAGGYRLAGGVITGNGAGLSNTSARIMEAQGMIAGRVMPMDSSYGYEAPIVIFGSIENTVVSNADGATISGGVGNDIGSNSSSAVIAGGSINSIGNDSKGASILGGNHNMILNDCFDSVIGGGYSSYIEDGSSYCAIGGGQDNGIGTNASCSTIPGGAWCTIGDNVDYSFAAGCGAYAKHSSTFVWSDFGIIDSFTSTGPKQFLVKASGGVGLGTADPLTQLTVERNVNASGTPENHVALIRNSSTGSNGDILALRSGYVSNPGGSINYVSFFKGDDALIGEIQGNGSGGVSYNTTGADYAEYVPLADGATRPEAGTIVGIAGGRVVTETETASRFMVVSDRAAVVGNVPGEDTDGYALICFIGQVPVWVRGPVQAGDYVVTGADGIGVAVAAEQVREADLGRIVGQAWESHDGTEPRRINTAIGLDQTAACRQVLQNELKEVRDLVAGLSQRVRELEAR